MAGDRRDRRRRAVERTHDVERLRQPQHFTQEMPLRPQAARGVGVFARIGFDQCDQLFEAARRQRRIDGHKIGRGDRERHRREILVGIERQLGKQRGIHDVGAERDQQRIAVGRRPRRLGGADIAGRAGDVLDIELLAEMLGELLRGKARENVGRTAGLERDDDADRPARASLRPCAGGPGGERAAPAKRRRNRRRCGFIVKA
jgi:hypothetical protein